MESVSRRCIRRAQPLCNYTIICTLLAAVASSMPLKSTSVTSPKSWMLSGAEKGGSHVMMWMFTSKQLLPRVTELSEKTRGLLECKCEELAMRLQECQDYAHNVTTASELAAFPSAATLKQEGKKTFGKVLMEDAYQTLVATESTLSSPLEGMEEPGPLCKLRCESNRKVCADRFAHNLHTASQQFQALITSFYGGKTTGDKKANSARGKTSKVPSSNDAIKTLFLAYNRFNQIASVLEYSIELSWFSQITCKPKEIGCEQKA